VGKRSKRIRIYSDNFGDFAEGEVSSLSPPEKPDWKSYLLGAGYILRENGYKIEGIDGVVKGYVPLGGGLSSSASVEVTITALWSALYNLNLSLWEIVHFSKALENKFVGVPCGIMDQTAAVFGKKGFAIFLDCRSLKFEYVKIPEEWNIVVCDTRVKRSLASSEYKKRQVECSECLSAIKKRHPEVKSLRDVKREWIAEVANEVSPVAIKRCRYVLEENDRVIKAISAFEKGDAEVIGELFLKSHKGLRDEYEVSCEELDFLVENAYKIKGVIGARMTGAGFGGNTVNLVKSEYVDGFVEEIKKRYREGVGREPVVRVLSSSDGLLIEK
jgi:galactokinase